ncbi:hypothetical protein D5F01_LYC04583 [Larimichthys crocea]|uniref:Uncharacterized protein n=1 Tax=Larimichthys crocea TaxID=215358 RepID=A0A6G0IWF2_LARCR|nr:hypothetical protein D5F01_LYC04583 [Larimichthys crocea]
MAPKHALLSSSGPEVGGVKNQGEPRSFSAAPWMLRAGMLAVCSPGNGKRTRRALDGMLARCFVSIGAVLMLMMQSSLAADAEAESMRRAVLPRDPAVPSSNFSSTPRTGDEAGAKDKDVLDGADGDAGAGRGAWSEGKVFAGTRTAVWTETEAEVRAGAGGKVFAETGIMMGTGAWAEVGAEWRPRGAEGGDQQLLPQQQQLHFGYGARRLCL